MALLLSEHDVARCLDMASLIPLMRDTLRRFSRRETVQPVRQSLRIRPAEGFYGVMPAHVPGENGDPGAFGLKSVSFFPGNDALGLPTHLATILLLDPRTGALVALLDGRLITETRTAAVSAVSADLLGKQGPVTLAILGSGVQAKSHLEAMKVIRPLKHVRVWSRRPERALSFVRATHQAVSCPVSAVPSVLDAMHGADIVVTATSAVDPIVPARALESGMHLCVVGSSSPRMRELDSQAVKRCRVWVDSREATQIEAGDILIPMREGTIDETHIIGELGDVIDGRSGRLSPDEITMFKSLGMAVEDVATASLVVSRARAKNIGKEITI